MANEKITDLDAHGAFADTDLIEVVDDPAGTPDNEKAEIGDLLDYAAGRNVREVAHASIPAASAAGLLTLVTDGVALARDTGAAQVSYGPIYRLVPLDQGAWSWVNQGGASVAQANGVVALSLPATSGALRARVTSAPGTPYTITAALLALCGTTSAAGNVSGFGLCFRESGTSKLIQLSYRIIGNLQPQLVIERWTNETTFSATSLSISVIPPLFFFRLADTGTNLVCSMSVDGVNFAQLLSESRTAFMAGAPDQVGIIGRSDTIANMGGSVVSWGVT